MPFCENCGTKLSDTAKFCSNCGQAVSHNQDALARSSQIPDGDSFGSGMSRQDLISCLSLYAESFWTIEKCISGLMHNEIAERAIKFIDFPDMNLLVFRTKIQEYMHRGMDFDYYRPLYSSMLFEADVELLKRLYPKYKAAQEDYKKCWESGTGKYIVGVNENSTGSYWSWEEENMHPLKNPEGILLFSQKDSDGFVECFKDPKNLRSLHEELCVLAPLERKEGDGRDFGDEFSKNLFYEEQASVGDEYHTRWVASYRLEYTVQKAVERTFGFLKPRIETIAKPVFSVHEFHRELCTALYEKLRDEKYPQFLEKALPHFIDAFAELALNLKPLCQRLPLPENYRSSKDIIALSKILQEGKADTWKEAVNLYDTAQYRERALEKLSDIKNELSKMREIVTAYSAASLYVSSEISREMRETKVLLGECRKKLSSIASSTLITAVFGEP